MTTSEPPWTELAIAVAQLDGSGEGVVVADGTLRHVALAVSRMPLATRSKTRVSLPDRGAPPFSYAGLTLAGLIAMLPADDDRYQTRPRSRRFSGVE